jgi:hypothetical protein
MPLNDFNRKNSRKNRRIKELESIVVGQNHLHLLFSIILLL